MKTVHSRGEFLAELAELRGGRLGLVLTMGALHEGHAALLRAARAECGAVVATVFVNPLQFGDPADLGRYPRTLEADAALAKGAGVDLLWAPAVDDVYQAGPVRVTVSSGELGRDLEGAARPGHFDGVLTVVAKFLGLIRPDVAYFGEKDYQQLTLISRMVADLDVGPQIVGVPTVRESDGLALSSRNVFIAPAQRTAALALSAALRAGADAASAGAATVLAAASAVLESVGVEADYVALRDGALGPAREGLPARLLVAARVGDVRLIDNIAIAHLGGEV